METVLGMTRNNKTSSVKFFFFMQLYVNIMHMAISCKGNIPEQQDFDCDLATEN